MSEPDDHDLGNGIESTEDAEAAAQQLIVDRPLL